MIEVSSVSNYSKAQVKKIVRRFMHGEYGMDANLIYQKMETSLSEYRKETNEAKKIKKKKQLDQMSIMCREIEDRGYLKIQWELVNDSIVAKTTRANARQIIDIDMTEFILKRDEKIVYINYREMWDAIAYELAQKDLNDLTIRQIDEQLMGCSIVSPNDGGILKLMGAENAYDRALNKTMIKSQYRLGTYSKNYFRQKVNDVNYYGALTTSVNKAMLIILEGTLGKQNKDSVELLGIYGDNIVYSVNLSDVGIKNELSEEYGVRMFNRLFEFKPKVTVI